MLWRQLDKGELNDELACAVPDPVRADCMQVGLTCAGEINRGCLGMKV